MTTSTSLASLPISPIVLAQSQADLVVYLAGADPSRRRLARAARPFIRWARETRRLRDRSLSRGRACPSRSPSPVAMPQYWRHRPHSSRDRSHSQRCRRLDPGAIAQIATVRASRGHLEWENNLAADAYVVGSQAVLNGPPVGLSVAKCLRGRAGLICRAPVPPLDIPGELSCPPCFVLARALRSSSS